MPREALPFPEQHDDEKAMLSDFLDWYRDCVARKVEGFSPDQLTRHRVSSPTTMLGIVKHLAYVERGWFQSTFLGEQIHRPGSDEDPDAEFRIEPDDDVESILDLYRGEAERSREIVAAGDLDAHAKRPDRVRYTLRWILIHMIEETARHAGHLDILREQTDGVTGE